MKTSNELPRADRRRCLSPEVLEDRMVLSAGQGSTFAIMPAAITTAGQASSVSFTSSSSLFTPATKRRQDHAGHRRHGPHADRLDVVEPPDDRDRREARGRLGDQLHRPGDPGPAHPLLRQDRQGQPPRQHADLGGPVHGQGPEVRPGPR